MKRAVPWLITAALLLAAWLVAFVTPDDDAAVAPFVVSAEIGEKAVGRALTVTVQDVRAGDGVTASDGWYADGTWLLVDLDAEANLEQSGSLLSGAVLQIGDKRYGASERMPSIYRTELVTGIPLSGTLAFELPDGALECTATLQLSLRDDTRVDSLIEVEFDLGALAPETDAGIPATEWTNP